MPLISVKELERRVGDNYQSEVAIKSITESALQEYLNPKREYDVFLCHSSVDEPTIRRLNFWLETVLGLNVFVDWIEMPLLDRANVTSETAKILRDVMKRSKTLLYAFSENSPNSTWMPWELGFSDGLNKRIAIAPISYYEGVNDGFEGQEYLGLYPYVIIQDSTRERRELWVHDPYNHSKYVIFESWQRGLEPYFH